MAQKRRLIAVLALLVIGAAIALTWFLLALGGDSAPDPLGSTGDQSSREAAPLPLEHPAAQAVEDYHRAIAAADCDLFLAVTSSQHRADAWQFTDCAGFARVATDFTDTVTDVTADVAGVFDLGDGTVAVDTEEGYRSVLPGEGGERYYGEYRYTLLQEASGWVIVNVDIETGTQ